MLEFETEVEVEEELKDNKRRYTKGTIKWGLDFECRKWGVKSFYISVPDQNMDVVWEVEDENGDTNSVDGVIEVKNCQYEFDIHLEGEVITPDTLYIAENEYNLVF